MNMKTDSMAKRGLEVLGLMMIGEAWWRLLFPTRYSLFWKSGPDWLRETARMLCQTSKCDASGVRERIAAGVWLAVARTGATMTVAAPPESHRGRVRRPQAPKFSGDTAGLAVKSWRARIRGEVRFDDGSRALYATDGSNYREVPIGVVIPRDVEDITNTIATARKFGAPILSRGCGTSLAGQCCNVAVVMDMSKYFNDIDPDRSAAAAGDGATGHCAGQHAQRRDEIRADLWPRSRDA